MRRPNILFVNTDQQSYDAVSAYGNPHVNTPGIDRLHANGVSFMRSYCTDPVCCPARSSWATGLYTSETGVPFNDGTIHGWIPDIGQLLEDDGYAAFHAGKWHVPGRDVRRSFRTLYFGRQPIGAGGGEFYDQSSTHAVLDFLSRYDGERPFYLQIGIVDPHDICEYEHSFEHRNNPDVVEQGLIEECDLPPLPRNFDVSFDETMVQEVCRRSDEALIHWPILQSTREWSELQWRSLLWNYYRFVEKADHELSVMLDALEASRFRNNTIVIFGSDHGEAAGQHQMFQKFTLYEESIRVPLIVASFSDELGIGKRRLDHEHLISGVDVFATICDYASIGATVPSHGRSLRPLAEGRSIPWRDYVYVESNYWGRSVVTARHKYITEYRPKVEEDFVPPGPDEQLFGREQLFDLVQDPSETRDLSGDSGSKKIMDRLRTQLLAHEATLMRAQLEPGRPRETVERWGERLSERWQHESN